MKKNRKYWKERLEEQEQLLLDQEYSAYEKRLIRMYQKALRDTERDISKLYDLVSRELNGNTIKMNDLYKYNRYFDLMNNLNKRLVKLGEEEIKILNEEMVNTYGKVQDIITKEAPTAISKTFVPSGSVEKIIRSIWCSDGKHWSDRIWSNKQDLQIMIEDALTDCVARGVSKDEWVKAIIERYETEFYKADRIMRTELAHVLNEATYDRYIASGIEKYQVMVAGDERACKHCLKKDNQVFLLSQRKVGENYPPFHPNCRCTIVPVLKEDK